MPASKDSVARPNRPSTLEGVPLPAAHPAPATCFCPPPSHPLPNWATWPNLSPGRVSVPEPKAQSLSSAPGLGAPFPTSRTLHLGPVLRPKKHPARSVLLNPSTGTRGSSSTSTYGPHSPLPNTRGVSGTGREHRRCRAGTWDVSGPVWPRAGTVRAGLQSCRLYSPPAPPAAAPWSRPGTACTCPPASAPSSPRARSSRRRTGPPLLRGAAAAPSDPAPPTPAPQRE